MVLVYYCYVNCDTVKKHLHAIQLKQIILYINTIEPYTYNTSPKRKISVLNIVLQHYSIAVIENKSIQYPQLGKLEDWDHTLTLRRIVQ